MYNRFEGQRTDFLRFAYTTERGKPLPRRDPILSSLRFAIHVLKRKQPAAISLFSGAGGMDLGVTQAEFDIKACVEIDRHCCATLRENIRRSKQNTFVYEQDIRTLSPATLMMDTGLKAGSLDLLFGGSPCQSFSQIGKQLALGDDRGLLLFQIVEFAKALRPRAIMVEQVKGLLSAKDEHGNKGGVFSRFVDDLDALGYVPRWRLMMAADYGIPQLRQRVFIVATQKPDGFQFPEPTHAKPENCNNLFALIPYETVGPAIQGLPDPIVKTNTSEVPDNSHYDVTPKRDKERIHGVPEGQYLASQLQLPAEQRCRLGPKDTTKFLRLDRNKPANTLRGGEIFFHPTEDRYLTPREYMRIHGYPDSYVLRGPVRGRSGTVRDLDQHRQIGNSVPPPLAKAIADEIRKTLNG